MTTVTPSQIVSKIVEVITGLTPAATPSSNYGFLENPTRNGQLRSWPIRAGSERIFRLFEVEVGRRDDVGLNQPGVTYCNLAMSVTIAYPSAYTLRGYDSFRDVAEIISADAQQIRNALALPSALVGPGHDALIPTIQQVQRGNDAVWFQDISLVAKFYVATV